MEDQQNLPLDLKATSEELNKLAQQEEQLRMLFKSDELLITRHKDIKDEQFELIGGGVMSVNGVKAMLRRKPRNIDPMFPYNIPFFELVFKLNGMEGGEHRKFIKPPFAGEAVGYVYKRFAKNVLPSLLELPNPVLYRYVRRYKLYQFLTDDGLLMLEGFIHDAIAIMEKSTYWKDFEEKYCAAFDLNVPAQQGSLFCDDDQVG